MLTRSDTRDPDHGVKVLKIFSDRDFLPAGKPHTTLLYPFWGKNTEDPRDPFSGRFDRYTENGRNFFEMTDLQSADIAVFPAAWENAEGFSDGEEKAARFFAAAAQARKPAVFFCGSDSDRDLPYSGAIVFRTSAKRSRANSKTFGLPAWSEDPLQQTAGRVRLRRLQPRPVVGFCGAAPVLPHRSLLGRLKSQIIDRSNSVNEDQFVRPLALQRLKMDARIQTNFLIRDSFLGGALKNASGIDYEILSKSRHEYFRNMDESDYILCARGQGNFSYRFYETLSYGRIPIFLDTDCLLPFQDTVDWQKYIVRVDRREIQLLAERVVRFHSEISEETFGRKQQECRKLWEEFLSPEGFFKNFYRHFV